MRIHAWWVVVAWALGGAPAAAQVVVSEAEALARLSSDSPRVRAIRADLDVARADVLAAGRWPNPRLVFNRESAAGITEDITAVAAPLPIAGRRTFEVRSASAMLDATSGRADDAIRRARADLRLAFAGLVAAQVRERELTRARDRLRDLARILATREAAGDAAGFDRLRAEREVLDVDTDRATAAADRADARAALAGFFGDIVDPATLVAAETPPAPPSLPPVQVLLDRAYGVRGDFLALDREIDAARWAERAAGRRRFPEPELLAGTKASSAAGGSVGSVLSVQAVLPLFDRARPELALARARATRAEARLDAFRRALGYQIDALRATALERREAADRYRAALSGSEGEIERIAQVSYEAGERGILELLDAYRTTAAARIRQALLDAAARAAEIELEFVSGWEIPS